MTETLCTSGSVIRKAGKNAYISGALITDYINQAECMVVVTSGVNWIDKYSTLNVDVKYILEDVTSNLAAMMVIQYDTSGFTSRREAELMLDVLDDRTNRGLTILKDKINTDFIQAA